MTFPFPAMSPISSPATDPFWSTVKLLLGFEGTDGATSTSDESPSPHSSPTFSGNAQIDTAIKKYGTSALLLDGTGDRIFFSADPDWQFGASDFTVEGWFNFAVNTTTQTLISYWATTASQRCWALSYNGASATDVLQVAYSTTGGAGVVGATTSAWTPTVGQWYHIAMDRNGSTWRVYVDGVMLAKQTNAVTLFAANTSLRIGNIDSSGEGIYFNGSMDEIRINKGASRYGSVYGDSSFTAPTAAFPRS